MSGPVPIVARVMTAPASLENVHAGLSAASSALRRGDREIAVLYLASARACLSSLRSAVDSAETSITAIEAELVRLAGQVQP